MKPATWSRPRRTMPLTPSVSAAGSSSAMARARALWAGILLLISTAGMYYAFGFGVFTMFPLALTGLAGILALAAGRPDEEVSHF